MGARPHLPEQYKPLPQGLDICYEGCKEDLNKYQ